MILETGKYQIQLYVEASFSMNSEDNLNAYDKVYGDASMAEHATMIGLKLFENKEVINSALVGSIGGGTGIHDRSQLIEEDRIIVSCSDSIFCLSIPELNLIWKTQADEATCFGIFKYRDTYIVHGELTISRLDSSGEIMWQQSGADIFTTPKGEKDFEITDSCIKVKDWVSRTYTFDFDGNVLE